MGVKIRERPGKGWYVLIDWNGQRKAKSFGKNKKEAKRFADKLTRKLKWAEENGESISLSRPDQEMPTVEEYLLDWLHTHAKVNCKMSTYEGYEQAIRVQLIPTFGSLALNTLKREGTREVSLNHSQLPGSPQNSLLSSGRGWSGDDQSREPGEPYVQKPGETETSGTTPHTR